MSTEDRLRDALHARAASVEPKSDGWERIEARMHDAPRSYRRYAALATAAAVVLAVALIGVVLRDTDDKSVNAGNGAPTTVSTTTSTTAPTDVNVGPSYIWPPDGPMFTAYDAPESVADAFARQFLGLTDPTLSAYRAGDMNSGEIDIHPAGFNSIVSTLLVRRAATGWVVQSATNDNLQLTSPENNEHITSPATLNGNSVAFEGVVHVTLLPSGATMRCLQTFRECGPTGDPDVGRPLSNTTYTGGGTEKLPFETHITFRPYTDSGLLVLWTDSARDGSLAGATVVRVAFG